MSLVIVGVIVVAALAGLAQTVTGFGFALVSVPILALLTDPTTAVVVVTLLSTLFTGGAAFHERGEIDWPLARGLTIAAICGLPLGLLAARYVEVHWLSVLIGVVVLACTAIMVWGGGRLGRPPIAGAGLLSGALLTSTGMNGPPLVMALQGRVDSMTAMRATLQATFFFQSIFAIGGFAIAGTLTAHSLMLAAIGVPSLALGWWTGQRVLGRISDRIARYAVLVLMALAGVSALVSGLTG